MDVEACCKAGTYSASVVIQHSGLYRFWAICSMQTGSLPFQPTKWTQDILSFSQRTALKKGLHFFCFFLGGRSLEIAKHWTLCAGCTYPAKPDYTIWVWNLKRLRHGPTSKTHCGVEKSPHLSFVSLSNNQKLIEETSMEMVDIIIGTLQMGTMSHLTRFCLRLTWGICQFGLWGSEFSCDHGDPALAGLGTSNESRR